MTQGRGRLVVLVLGACLLVPATIEAQQRRSFAVDLTGGPAIGNGGAYEFRRMNNYRLAFTVRRERDSSLALFGGVSAEATVHSMCGFSGTCRGDYPELAGIGFTIGGMLRPRPRVEMRLGVGMTVYMVTNAGPDFVNCPAFDQSCGRQGDNSTLGFTAQSDVAVFPVKHVGLVAGSQYIVMPRYLEDRPRTLWMAPFVFGIRVR